MGELLAVDGLMRLGALGFISSQGAESVVMHRLVAFYVQSRAADRSDAARDSVEQTLVGVAQTIA